MGKCIITQKFGQNENDSYASAGLLGHTGIDESCGYLSEIYPRKRIFVYKVLDKNHPANDGSGFWAVFGIDEDGHEWLYGHCIPKAKVGQWYETNQVIGLESNRGTVYSGGIRITPEMQDAGDSRGHHRHTQKRLCERVRDLVWPNHYLTSFGGEVYKDSDGYYYRVKDWSNGFNGCVDWTKDDIILAKASDRVAVIAAQAQARGSKDVTILWAIVKILKAFGQ